MSQPTEDVIDKDTDPILIGTKEVARLMGVTTSTLRNYVWLQKLTEEERERYRRQSPPKGMPRPENIKGKNMWPARIMRPWAVKWAASGANECACAGDKFFEKEIS